MSFWFDINIVWIQVQNLNSRKQKQMNVCGLNWKLKYLKHIIHKEMGSKHSVFWLFNQKETQLPALHYHRIVWELVLQPLFGIPTRRASLLWRQNRDPVITISNTSSKVNFLFSCKFGPQLWCLSVYLFLKLQNCELWIIIPCSL